MNALPGARSGKGYIVMETKLRIGCGKAAISLEESCFPADNFAGVHDPLHVRVIVMEQGEGKACVRYGIMAVDITSMFPGTVVEYKQIMKEKAGVEEANSWIAATHSFSAPHLWEVPKPGEPDIVRPGHPARSQEEIEKCIRLNAAFSKAAAEAAMQAAGSLRPAVCGAGAGECLVNASRNMETKDGWWLGCDAEQFSDHVLPVLKFESLKGEPLALLFAYDCQSSVMGMSRLADGTRLMSSDLLGAASAYVEKEYGEGFVALGLCGAAGDQEPQLKSKRNEIDREGRLRTIDLGEAGFALLEAQGCRLGAELLKTSERIRCAKAAVKKGRRGFACDSKVMERNVKMLHPTHSYAYVPEGTKDVEAQAFVIGDFAIVGTGAELASKTAAQIRGESPFACTAVATMVDGSAKYMVDAEAYDRFTYGAMNSAFMRGSAEKLRDESLALLRELKEN